MRNANRACVGLAAALVLSVVSPLGLAVPPGVAEEACGGQPCTWNFAQIEATSAQPLGNHGDGVSVAIVDTWVDHTHPELRDKVIGHALCVGSGGRCQANTRSPDECAHGTHVAGTVASTNYGVARKAKLLAVQVLSYDGDTCSGSAEDVSAGIRYAAAHGTDVINLSLGTLVPGLFQSQAVRSAVHDAARAGAVVVLAAGNSTVPVSDDYGSDVVLVAATGPSGSLASYSSRGGAIDLAAPGGDDGVGGLASCDKSTCILSTEPNSAYALREGTSMAAPHVSGAAALLLSQHPQRGRADVITTLRETARPLSGVRNGLIDAESALRLRGDHASTTPGGTNNSAGRGTGSPSASAAPAFPTPPRLTPSGQGILGVGPYDKDLAKRAAATKPGASEPGPGSADLRGQRTEPPVAQHPSTDPSDPFPLPLAVAVAALLVLIAGGAVHASAGRPRIK